MQRNSGLVSGPVTLVSVANLFSSSFSDADSDTFVGIVITANAADFSTEGVWQYSTDNSSN